MAAQGQILDLDMECPIVYAPEYILQNNIHSISFVQSGGNMKKEMKKHMDAVITYFFDSSGIACMKVLNDKGGYMDTFMLNAARCQYKNDPESRFYEENLFCNGKGMILANQTDKSNFYYRYDSLDRLIEWIQIDRQEDEESPVTLTRYSFDSLGHIDSITEKEGVLRYDLSVQKVDTIYRSTVVRTISYAGDKMSAVITYTDNNREQTIAVSTYRYKYRNGKPDQIELYIGEEKNSIYTLKVLKTELIKKDDD